MGLIASVGGLVHLAPAPFGSTWLRVALLLFVIPAFGEELLFRALLVPRPDQPFLASRAVLIIALFVAWHPFQALTFGPPWAAMFLDPWFLGAVAVLGATSTAIYRTTGSIWPCIGMHWLVVASWKLIFGGPF